MPDAQESPSDYWSDVDLKDRVSMSITVGHCIAVLDDEAAVVISLNQVRARLSPGGARIVAAQLVQWADHAEAQNKERPAKDVAQMVYRMMARCDEKTKEWSVASEPAAPPAAAPEPAELPTERAEVHVKLQRAKPAAKRKSAKRKRPR